MHAHTHASCTPSFLSFSPSNVFPPFCQKKRCDISTLGSNGEQFYGCGPSTLPCGGSFFGGQAGVTVAQCITAYASAAIFYAPGNGGCYCGEASLNLSSIGAIYPDPTYQLYIYETKTYPQVADPSSCPPKLCATDKTCQGRAIEDPSSLSFDACTTACKNNALCLAFTHAAGSQTCSLFSDCLSNGGIKRYKYLCN